MGREDVDVAAWVCRVSKERFPGAAAVVLGGSHASGTANSRSDVDIAVIHNEVETAYRESSVVDDKPVEWFVFTERTLPYFFREARRNALPTVLHLLAKGRWLESTNLCERWRSRAALYLKAGPVSWTLDEMNQARYELTELLEDMEASRDRAERLILAQVLGERLLRFYLRAEGGWLGEGKWLWRMLVQHNPDVAARYASAWEQFCQKDQTGALIQLADELLGAYGGRWFHGYYAEINSPQSDLA